MLSAVHGVFSFEVSEGLLVNGMLAVLVTLVTSFVAPFKASFKTFTKESMLSGNIDGTLGNVNMESFLAMLCGMTSPPYGGGRIIGGTNSHM